MTVVPSAQRRRTETPNAVMTTLASPSQGGSALSVWRVDMPPGATGPMHAFDTEQVWTVLEGGATVELAGERLSLAAGDTVVLPADQPRQIQADAGLGMTVIACAPGGTRLHRDPAAAVPKCAMAEGDRLRPDWVA